MKSKIGILGGGQLGMMTMPYAKNLNIELSFLDKAESSTKQAGGKLVEGDFLNKEDVLKFGQMVDIISIEIENVNIDALKELEKMGKKVFPSPSLIEMIQDKGLQKQWLVDHHFLTSPFYLTKNSSEIKPSRKSVVQKLRRGGYDGKGVKILSPDGKTIPFEEPSVIEEKIEIQKELAIIVARNQKGEVKTFPVTEVVFDPDLHLMNYLLAPATISESIQYEMMKLASKMAEELKLVGLLAIECFLDQDHQILVNELAPRPHNSGHFSIEACKTSQFEQWLRAISHSPLGETDQSKVALTANLVGAESANGKPDIKNLKAMEAQGAHVTWYQKPEVKPGRKMGHVTILSESSSTAIEKFRKIEPWLKIKS